jgi:hypothetical protein
MHKRLLPHTKKEGFGPPNMGGKGGLEGLKYLRRAVPQFAWFTRLADNGPGLEFVAWSLERKFVVYFCTHLGGVFGGLQAEWRVRGTGIVGSLRLQAFVDWINGVHRVHMTAGPLTEAGQKAVSAIFGGGVRPETTPEPPPSPAPEPAPEPGYYRTCPTCAGSGWLGPAPEPAPVGFVAGGTRIEHL